MQSKIRVYESGRAEQEYDPDLPPELAAAAGHDISYENRNFGKVDVQSYLASGGEASPPPPPHFSETGGGGEGGGVETYIPKKFLYKSTIHNTTHRKIQGVGRPLRLC
ncbi:hypothetical protein Hdeb2414_s0113g00799001 [Helianthus debilis subsp. tardiflorus]